MKNNKLSKMLFFVLAFVGIAASAQAQTAPVNTPVAPAVAPQAQASGATKQPKNDVAAAADQYQSSLKTLAASYDDELKRVTDRNATLKDLLEKGLVSRREVEQSDGAVAEAQAKVDGVKKEMASAQAQAQKSLLAASMVNQAASDVAWSTGSPQIDALIRTNGDRYGVDPYLIYCVINQESNFSAMAVSGKGAQGLMQLMPDTAARYGVTNPFDPAQSIKAGAHYLKDLLNMFDGSVELALAGYNAGEGSVMKYGNRIPPYEETKYYVRNITARYRGTGVRKTAAK